MWASSNTRTCTQWAVIAQMAKHSLVKVHARMSVGAGQHPTHAEPGALHHQAWSLTTEHATGSTRVHRLCSHPLSLSDAAGRASHTCSPMQAQQQLAQGAKHTGRHSYSIVAHSGCRKPVDATAAHVDLAAAGAEREACGQAQQANRRSSTRVCGRPNAHPDASMALLIFSTNRARLTFIISCPEVRKCNVKKLFHNFVKLMRSHGS
jgi:hypothetical protein